MPRFCRVIGPLLSLAVLLAACKPEADLTVEEVLENLPEESASTYLHNANIADVLDQHLPLPHHDEPWSSYEARMRDEGIVFNFGLPEFARASGGSLGPRDRLTVLMCDDSQEQIESVSFHGYDPDLADAVLADGLSNGFMIEDPLNADDIEYGLTERFTITNKFMTDDMRQYPSLMYNLAGFVTFFTEDGATKKFVTSSRFFTC